MARIRTVKPQYWTDGKIARLPDHTALFFIALWNFSDDYGYFSLDTLELSLSMSRWRSQSINRMLRTLSEAGLIRVSTGSRGGQTGVRAGSGVGQVVGWEHQRIKDRHLSKWNGTLIIWDQPTYNAPESEKNGPVLDRIGKDRKGFLTGRKGAEAPLPLPEKTEEPKAELSEMPQDPSESRQEPLPPQQIFVARYIQAFRGKFGETTRPELSTKTLAQIRVFLTQFDLERAVNMIEAYFKIQDPWFETKCYDFVTFMQNIEKVSLSLQTGSNSDKPEQEKKSTLAEQVEREMAESFRIRDEQERQEREQCNS